MEINKIHLFRILGCLTAVVLVLSLSVHSYTSYKKELIEIEEKQLLTMAETVGKSLVNYIGQELEGIDMFFSSPGFSDCSAPDQAASLAAASYLEQNSNLYHAAVCHDSDGKTVFQSGTAGFDSVSRPPSSAASISGKALTPQGQYEMFLSKSFSCGSEKYDLLLAMDLNQIYKKIVEPVQIGVGGYSTIKDSDLSIIMHHASNMIGMDAVYDRRVQFPNLDLTDLIELIHLQETEPSGYRVIRSYEWDSPSLKPQKRIVAYTTIYLPGERWIVNSTLPFEELGKPLRTMIFRITLISGFCLLSLTLFVFLTARAMTREESQKKEIEYLKEINQGMELLRHKEEEIRHYQKVQTIGLMSSHISHEFNNYLTPVLVYGEILEKDPSLSAENKEIVKGILDSTNQAAALSRKLLDFSRQDTAKIVSLDLAGEVRRAAAMIQKIAPDGITFITDIPENPLYIRGQKGMAEHILMNLSKNAFHAMEDKSGQASGTLKISLALKEQVVLTVSDTGCGISKEALDKIFEPFYTTKRSGKGTGLGLSVVRNIVTASGGQIQIDSEVGKGTSFILTFPETGAPAVSAPGRKVKSIDRLVIVDDDKALLDSLKKMAESWPFKTECFNHPAAILSKLQSKPHYCDMLLTDYSMPVMNGLEFAEIVRRLNPDIKVILMSGAENERFNWYLENKIIDRFLIKTELFRLLSPDFFQEIMKTDTG